MVHCWESVEEPSKTVIAGPEGVAIALWISMPSVKLQRRPALAGLFAMTLQALLQHSTRGGFRDATCHFEGNRTISGMACWIGKAAKQAGEVFGIQSKPTRAIKALVTRVL